MPQQSGHFPPAQDLSYLNAALPQPVVPYQLNSAKVGPVSTGPGPSVVEPRPVPFDVQVSRILEGLVQRHYWLASSQGDERALLLKEIGQLWTQLNGRMGW